MIKTVVEGTYCRGGMTLATEEQCTCVDLSNSLRGNAEGRCTQVRSTRPDLGLSAVGFVGSGYNPARTKTKPVMNPNRVIVPRHCNLFAATGLHVRQQQDVAVRRDGWSRGLW